LTVGELVVPVERNEFGAVLIPLVDPRFVDCSKLVGLVRGGDVDEACSAQQLCRVMYRCHRPGSGSVRPRSVAIVQAGGGVNGVEGHPATRQ
jgi:hypothetical protein